MGLVRLALGNVYGVVVAAIALGVLGGVAISSVPVDILPAFKVPAVQVLTYYNGMPAGSVEKTITNRIERWVNQAPGAAQVESRSIPGVSVVRVIFREDIDPNAALTMSNSLALSTLPTLPPNTLPPVVLPYDPTGTLPLGILTVSNPSMTEAGVKDVARIDVRNRLGGVRGVVAPTTVGGKDRTILVYLDPKKLQARNLSATDVVRALQDGNLMVTPGTAYFGDNQVLLDTNAMVANVDELNLIPIKVPGGEVVLLGDIGHAEDASSIQTSRVRVNGKQQVFVPIYRQGGASSLAVADGVRAAIPDLEKRLPEGTRLDFVIDQSEYVRKAIESLIHEGVIGAILVSLMILVFLGDWRMTVIASLSLPLAILGAIIGLRVCGQTINVMTLGGLFLAIGPLVDNAIVVLENTHRHLTLGKTPFQAAADACSELTLPVLVATLALIIVLCPVALTPGVAGFLFQPLTLAVAFAMIASYLLSWTFVPAMCSKMLRGHGHHGHQAHRPRPVGFFGTVYGYINAAIESANRLYILVLGVALRNRLLVLGAVSLLFAASLSLVLFIGQEFFPQVDAGQITVTVRGPSSYRLDATERRVAEVEKFVEAHVPAAERQMIVSEIGLNPDWSAAYTQNAGQMDAVVRLQLTPGRTKSSQEYAVLLRHALAEDPRFADLQFAFDTGGMVTAALNFGSSSPIDIEIPGGSAEPAMAVAREVRARTAAVRGAADVRIKQRFDAPYLILDVNRPKAAELGLSARDVVMQVVAAMNSSTSINRNFWIDVKTGNQYFVAVQYPEDPDRTLGDLERIFATGTSSPKTIPLASLVELRPSTAAVEYNHNSLARVVNVQVNTEGRDTGGVARDIDKQLRRYRAELDGKAHEAREKADRAKEKKAPDAAALEAAAKEAETLARIARTTTLSGEYARMVESFRSLGAGLALASVLVYLLMVPLMRSFLMPLIIMATVPLGLIGVLVMLWATKTTLNVQSEMGVIFLVGIVVSQGVLLMDFANQLRKQGRTAHEAITQAAAIRFRPIMMTFLATFLDLLPMAIGVGRGSESLTPLARAVVGGLLSATALTLIVVPVLFTLLVRDKHHQPGHHDHPPEHAA